MAKVTLSLATKDDPIFTGRSTISSVNSNQELEKSKKTSQDDTAGQSTVKEKPVKGK
jgi:hypothetical protein